MKNFLITLPPNIVKSFARKNVFFHLAAIVATFIILKSGLDWRYFLAVRNPALNQAFFPALIIGGLLPILLPICLIVLGAVFHNKKRSIMGWCLAQAAFIGWLVSSTYKAFTGRVQPDLINIGIDSSHSFNFGFLQHGIFWGWPSSHTTVAFAMSFALIALLVFSKKSENSHTPSAPISAKKKWIAIIAIAYALYVGIGVSFAIHWLSEFIAGALIGTAIGVTVGKSFKEHF